MRQPITRKATFDAAHRIVDHNSKCKNIHGHLYQYELTFEFGHQEDIGYAIDFAEIKRIYMQWIDDAFDHGIILNPADGVMIAAAKAVGSKVWLMGLEGGSYCNPSVENIVKELFLGVDILVSNSYPLLELKHIKLHETLNCYTECTWDAITEDEEQNFVGLHHNELVDYANKKGTVAYDVRQE